ncbi:hypothetical protein Pyn_37842 [Prunus yedoensis var. nudiflora]|uniref:Uncharacterized protein n=1 Tax=Prunus yedoensis var. nudiflora TaxID=2094558 RepID=A0A314V1J3_PRUYE|nr:hypothetical protein Pyn_37842 [Prunus yedoensis var. nudiflora]
MLLFKFALPDASNMADMTRLVALVPYYIDLIWDVKFEAELSYGLGKAKATTSFWGLWFGENDQIWGMGEVLGWVGTREVLRLGWVA